MRFTGTLKTWNDERGYGFIEPIDGGQQIFVHIKNFPSGTGRPAEGQVLSFEVETRANGKKSAFKVQYPSRANRTPKTRIEEPASWTLARSLAIPAFIALCVFASWRWGLKWQILVAYIVMSILTIFAYAFDKSAAQSKRWRTPESTLHMLSLLGGWPGALIGQQLLRHKTNKQSFVHIFWFTVIVNIFVFIVLSAGLMQLIRP